MAKQSREEYLRRIELCVSACSGISNQALESGAINNVIFSLAKLVEANDLQSSIMKQHFEDGRAAIKAVNS